MNRPQREKMQAPSLGFSRRDDASKIANRQNDWRAPNSTRAPNANRDKTMQPIIYTRKPDDLRARSKSWRRGKLRARRFGAILKALFIVTFQLMIHSVNCEQGFETTKANNNATRSLGRSSEEAPPSTSATNASSPIKADRWPLEQSNETLQQHANKLAPDFRSPRKAQDASGSGAAGESARVSAGHAQPAPPAAAPTATTTTTAPKADTGWRQNRHDAAANQIDSTSGQDNGGWRAGAAESEPEAAREPGVTQVTRALSLVESTGSMTARLEAKQELRKTLQQLHFNKSLALGALARDAAAALPGRDAASELQTPTDGGSSAAADQQQRWRQQHQQQQQLVSVSPTNAPSQLVEYRPIDPLETAAADEQQRAPERLSATGQPRTSAIIATSAWGRRKSTPDTQRREHITSRESSARGSAYDDIATWTPAAGPAAYLAGTGWRPASSIGANLSYDQPDRNADFFAPASEYLRPIEGPSLATDRQRQADKRRLAAAVTSKVDDEHSVGSHGLDSNQSAKYADLAGKEQQAASETNGDEQDAEELASTPRPSKVRAHKLARSNGKSRAKAQNSRARASPMDKNDDESNEKAHSDNELEAGGKEDEAPEEEQLTSTRRPSRRRHNSEQPKPIRWRHERQHHPKKRISAAGIQWSQADTSTGRNERAQRATGSVPTSASSSPPVIRTLRPVDDARATYAAANVSANYGVSVDLRARPSAWPQPSTSGFAPVTEQLKPSASPARRAPTNWQPADAAPASRANAQQANDVESAVLAGEQQRRPGKQHGGNYSNSWSIVLLPYPRPTPEAVSYFSVYNQPVLSGVWPQASEHLGAEHWNPSATSSSLTPGDRHAQAPMLRGARQAPAMFVFEQQPQPADTLTINLKTRAVTGPNQLFWQAAAREAAVQQQQHQAEQPQALGRVPLTNGHLPPQHREPAGDYLASGSTPSVEPVQQPRMRRPSAGTATAGAHTNGHALAGSPSVGLQLALANPEHEQMFSSAELVPIIQSFAQVAAAATAGGYELGSPLAMMAANSVSSFASPSGSGVASDNQFVKKGSSSNPGGLISAALPLAVPERVRDPYGWPMAHGSQAAKSLLRVNHVAPPPSYLIAMASSTPVAPQQTAERQLLHSARPIEHQHQQQSSDWAPAKLTSTSPIARPTLVSQHSALATSEPIRPNVIHLSLSTRAPTRAPGRRGRLWKRLKLFRVRDLVDGEQAPGARASQDGPQVTLHRFKRGLREILPRRARFLAMRRFRYNATAETGDLSVSDTQNVRSVAWTPPAPSPSQAQQGGGRPGNSPPRGILPRAHLAVVSVSPSHGPHDRPGDKRAPQRAFIPLLDTEHLLQNLERDLLVQALMLDAQQQHQHELYLPDHRARTNHQDSLAGGHSMRVVSFAPLNAPAGIPSVPGWPSTLEQQVAASANSVEFATSQLEPPANEPGSVNLQSSRAHVSSTGTRGRIRQLSNSIIRSSRRPLDKLVQISRSNFTSRFMAPTHSNKATPAPLKKPSATSTTLSLAQQFNSITSPAVMLAGSSAPSQQRANSLDNFNRFAAPLSEWLAAQQRQVDNNMHAQRPLLPLANHMSQAISPYTFVTTNQPLSGQSLFPFHSSRQPFSSDLPIGQLNKSFANAVERWSYALPTTNDQTNEFLLGARLPQLRSSTWRRESGDLDVPFGPNLNIVKLSHRRQAGPPPNWQRQSVHPQPFQRQYPKSQVKLRPSQSNRVLQVTTKPSFRFVSAQPNQQQQQSFGSELGDHSSLVAAQNGSQISYTDAEVYSSSSDRQAIELQTSGEQQPGSDASNSADLNSLLSSSEEIPILLNEQAPATAEAQFHQPDQASTSQQVFLPPSGHPTNRAQQFAPMGNSAPPNAMLQPNYYGNSFLAPFGNSNYVQRPRLSKFSIPSINSITSKFRQHLMQAFRLNPLASSASSFGPTQMLQAPPVHQWMQTAPGHEVGQANFGFYHQTPQHEQAFQSLRPAISFAPLQQQQQTQTSNNYHDYTRPQPNGERNFVQQQATLQHPSGLQEVDFRQKGQLVRAVIGQRQHHQKQSTHAADPMEFQQLLPGQQAVIESPTNVNTSIETVELQEAIEPTGFIGSSPSEQAVYEHEADGADRNGTVFRQMPSPLQNVMTDISTTLVTSDGTVMHEDQIDAQQQQQHQRQHRQHEQQPQELQQQQPLAEDSLIIGNTSTELIGQQRQVAENLTIQQITNGTQSNDTEANVVSFSLAGPGQAPQTSSIVVQQPEQVAAGQQDQAANDNQVGNIEGPQQLYEFERVPGARIRSNIRNNSLRPEFIAGARKSKQQQQPIRHQDSAADYQVIRASPSQQQVQEVIQLSNGTVDAQLLGSSKKAANYTHIAIQTTREDQQVSVDSNYQQVDIEGPANQPLEPSTGEQQQQLAVGQNQVYEPSNELGVPRAESELQQQQQLLVEMPPVLKEQNKTSGPMQYDFRPVVVTSSSESAGNSIAPSASSPTAGEQFILIDQPVVLAGQASDSTLQPTPSGTATTSSSEKAPSLPEIEPPSVFVRLKPERVIKQQTAGSSGLANRKRPLKMPKRAQSVGGTSGKSSESEKVADSSTDNKANQSLAAGNGQASFGAPKSQNSTRSSTSTTTSSTTTSTTTTRRPSEPHRVALNHAAASSNAQPQYASSAADKLKNHNLKTGGSLRDSFTRAPKARIRWQGANSVAGGNSSRPSELSSAETQHHEQQAWLVGGMTHQTYASAGNSGDSSVNSAPKNTSLGAASITDAAAANDPLQETAPVVDSTARPSALNLSTETSGANGADQGTRPTKFSGYSSNALPANHRASDEPAPTSLPARDSRTSSTSFRLSSSGAQAALARIVDEPQAGAKSVAPSNGAELLASATESSPVIAASSESADQWPADSSGGASSSEENTNNEVPTTTQVVDVHHERSSSGDNSDAEHESHKSTAESNRAELADGQEPQDSIARAAADAANINSAMTAAAAALHFRWGAHQDDQQSDELSLAGGALRHSSD